MTDRKIVSPPPTFFVLTKDSIFSPFYQTFASYLESIDFIDK